MYNEKINAKKQQVLNIHAVYDCANNLNDK